ncbi:MAG: M23 family metallopeptidase [Gaiellaceae bacterium]
MAHRTSARGTLFLTLAALFSLGLVTASSQAASSGKVPRLVFPILGEATWTDDFGDARGQGSHEGNDLLAPRRALALAAEAGRVKFWTTSARAGCMLYLEGSSGTQYLYIHLNNDLTDENDNRGTCVPGVAYAKGLASGDKVAAGDPIGFVGDSGDANGTSPHLHFEVHPDGGGATNPFPHLKRASRLLFAAARGTTFTAAVTGKVVAAAADDLQVSVDQVRWWPGGRKSRQPGQKLTVFVPETASVEGVATAPGGLAYPTIDLLLRGSTVTVWTEPAKVTLAAQTGVEGALSAARVVLKR